MSRDLQRRLSAVEKASLAPSKVPSRAKMRKSVALLQGTKACVVAAFAGGWRSGLDGMTCVLKGIDATHTPGMTRSLLWAYYKAERAASGLLGDYNSRSRLEAAFLAIGDDRADLFDSIGDVLNHANLIGDPVIIGIADRFASGAVDA